MENFKFVYENFNALKGQIFSAMDVITNVSQEFGKNGDLQRLKNIRTRLEEEKFKVLFVGEFKRGKSTLVNSMIGKNILPAKVAPCTAVITEIIYKEKPMAIVYHKDKNKAPFQVEADKLEQTLQETVVIRHNGTRDNSSQEEDIRQTPYERVELYYPLEICRNGIIIIDSPGLNEDITREEITRSYMPTSDAAVLVMRCDMFISASEEKFIKNDLKHAVHDNLFFIANALDSIENDGDWQDINNRAQEYLTPLVNLPLPQRLFFCSARQALKGKLENNTSLLSQSGVPQFEMALEEYLVKYKTKVKLENAILSIIETIADYEKKDFDNRLRLFSQPIDELEKNRKMVEPKFQEAETRKQKMMQLLSNRKTLIIQTALGRVRDFFYELERKEIDFIKKYEFKNFNMFSPKKAVEDELMPEVGRYFSKEIDAFIKEDLVPKIQKEIEQALLDMHEDAKKVEKILNDIRITINPDYKINSDEEQVGSLERIIAAAGGWLLGGIGSAAVGGTLGLKEMFKSFLPNFSVGLSMLLLGFNPILIIPTLLALGIYQVFKGNEGLQNSLKQKVADHIPNMMREKRPEIEKAITQEMAQKIDAIFNSLEAGLDNMINNIKCELDKVIDDKRKKTSELDLEKQKIDQYRTHFAHHRDQLEKILFAFPA